MHKPLIIRKGPDTDVATWKLMRNGAVITGDVWPAGASEVSYTDTVETDGDYVWTAVLSDATPNQSGLSNPVADRLDRTAPKVTMGALPMTVLEPFAVTGEAVDNLGGELVMTAEFNGSSLGEPVSGSFGQWTADPTGLAPGVYSVRVMARDAKGNEGWASASVEVVRQAADSYHTFPPGRVIDVNGQRILT